MSRALIIKGANFSANAVEKITISDPVPCTGITLSESSISLNTIGGTQTITPTVTPNDCTDNVIWTSSDDAVATVTNGVVTAVGIGTATITATCGSFSDTCSVAVENITATTKWLVGFCAPAANTGASVTDNTGRLTCVQSIEAGDLAQTELAVAFSASPHNQDVLKAIEIPDGATTFTMHQTGMKTYATAYVCFYDGTTAGNSTYPSMLKCIEKQTKDTNTSAIDFTIPEGAIKLNVCLSTGTTYDYATDADAVAEGYAISFTFS